MGRVHRPVRAGRRASRSAAARLRLSASRSTSRTAQMVEAGRLLFVIDPRPYQAARRPGEGRARRAPRRALELAQLAARSAPSALVDHVGRCRARPTTSAMQELRRRRKPRCSRRRAALPPAELDLEFTAGHRADQRPRLRPPGRHRQPGHGDPSTTLLTTIVALDPIYFNFDMSESGLPGLPARLGARRPAVDARQRRPSVAGAAGRRDATGRMHGTMNFVDNVSRPGHRHDPRPAPSSATRTASSRPASSAACASRARSPTRRDPHPGQRHRHRPVATRSC